MAADKKLLASLLGPDEETEPAGEDVESDRPEMGAAEIAVEEFSSAIQEGDTAAATEALRAAVRAIMGED